MFGSTRDRNAEAQRAQRIHLGISSASLRFKTYAAEPVGLLIDFHEVKSLDGLYRIIHNFSETQCLGVQEIETQRRGGRREFIYASPLRSPRFKTHATEPVGLLKNSDQVKLVDRLHRIVQNFKEAP
jgi:hypothetical protein